MFFKSRSSFKIKVTGSTKHKFVKHTCPRRQQSQNMTKISKSYILLPPQRHAMSVKCEEPLDELTVQVWLLYYHQNFKYCTVCKWDDPITRRALRTIQEGGIKITVLCERSCHKEYTCAVWKPYLMVWKLWPRLKFLKRRSNFKVKVTRSKKKLWCTWATESLAHMRAGLVYFYLCLVNTCWIVWINTYSTVT